MKKADVEQTNQNVGRSTFLCRWICCGLLAAPLLYWSSLGYKADAVVLLVLALLSAIAGLALFVNSIFCLIRYRKQGQFAIGVFFVLISVIGVLAMPYVLPGWKM